MATISNPLIRARGSVALRSGVRMHSPRTTPTSPISAAAAAAATCRQRLPTLIAHQRPLSSSPRCVPLTNRYFSSSSSNSDNNTSTAEQQAQQLKQVRFEDINSAPSTDRILIDVREPAELSSTGIIPGAVSIPLASQPDAYFLSPEEFETRFGFSKPGSSNGEKKNELVFYCKAGVRARAAAQLAVQAGYDPERIAVYDGSWLDWVDKGGKVEKWEGSE